MNNLKSKAPWVKHIKKPNITNTVLQTSDNTPISLGKLLRRIFSTKHLFLHTKTLACVSHLKSLMVLSPHTCTILIAGVLIAVDQHLT